MRYILASLMIVTCLPARVLAEQPAPVPPQEIATSATPEDPLAAVMEQARQAFSNGDYPRAIQLYSKLLDNPDMRYQQDALEMLGVARERNGQQAQAKAIYDKYLAKYTQGEAVERVKQRLAGLVTADWKPKDKLPEQQAQKPAEEWRVNGSFSQYLRHSSSTLSGQSSSSDQSNLVTALDVSTRGRTGALDIRTRINGSYLYDFNNSVANNVYLNVLYLDVNTPGNFSTRLGRQSQYDGGVLGRFDGASARLRLNPMYTIKVAAGLPVERSSIVKLDTSRKLYSVSLDITPTDTPWRINSYLIDQYANGLSDRRAVGIETRYFQSDRSLINLVDYDIGFNQLNIFMLQGTLPLTDKTLLNIAADYRATPLLSTRNALIGQSTANLQTLQGNYTEQQIRDLARDRSAISQMAMIGLSHQLSPNYRADGDASISNVSATPASGGVTSTTGTGNEYFVSGRLTINNLLQRQDVTFLGLRAGKLYNADSLTANANLRLLTPSGWRINPGLRADYRKYNQQNQTQLQLAPNLRIDYQWAQRYHVEAEGGYEWSKLTTWYGDQTTKTVFFHFGYRVDF